MKKVLVLSFLNVLSQSKLCDVVWGSLSSTELQTLQYLQNRALSIIESARVKDPWPKKWLNVENFIRFDRSVLVYKLLDKLCPESLWHMFQFRSSFSNYNTGHDKDLHIPKVKLEFSKGGFQYAGIRAWNDIPNNIRELSSLSLLESQLRRHLISNEN